MNLFLKFIILNLKNILNFFKDKLGNKNYSSNIIRISRIKFLLSICLIPILIFLIKKKMNIYKSFYSNNIFNSLNNENDFLKQLKNILKDDEIFENELMNKHTTFRIGGPAKYFVKPKTIKQIKKIIYLCNQYKIKYFVLGNGSNLLVSDFGYLGIIIQIKENNFSNLKLIKNDENTYSLKVGAGMLMKTLSIESCLLSLTGLEDIIDIPGTLGGGIIMNVSFRGTGLRESLIKVKVITPEGKIKELSKKDCGLIHRGSKLKDMKYIVIEAVFKLHKGDQMIIQKTMTNNTKNRYKKQPMYFGSAGCFFVWNHTEYGSLYKRYKESNLVSYRVGNIMIYTYNISFIINLGKGTASQVMEIVEYIKKVMKEKYNIEMKREVIVIGIINGIEYY